MTELTQSRSPIIAADEPRNSPAARRQPSSTGNAVLVGSGFNHSSMGHFDGNTRLPRSPVHERGWTIFDEDIRTKSEITLWRSDADDDPAWDAFLLGTSLGQFQQSSAWARVKRIEGWKAVRFMAVQEERIVAGFQLLWKRMHGLRVGYVSKGPVVIPTPAFTGREAIALLKHATRHLHLSALIAQPPDFGNDLEPPMLTAGFLENYVHEVYSATVLVDISRPFAEVQRGFSHDVGRQIRNLRKSKITTRFGDATDAELFFSLMKHSCAKQGVAPNPGNADAIRTLIREFEPQDSGNPNRLARFLFAERDGRAIAGFLLIRFGECLSLWKKGVVDDIGRVQPNRLLDSEAMQWGKSAGCQRYDVVAIATGTARALLAGYSRKDVPIKPSDSYKLDFGGTPKLLPAARVWIPSPILRAAYFVGLLIRRPGVAGWLRDEKPISAV